MNDHPSPPPSEPRPPGSGALPPFPGTAAFIAVALLASLLLVACSDNTTRSQSTPATSAIATITMVARDGPAGTAVTPGPGGPASFEVAFPNLPEFERPVVMLEIPGQDRMLLALQEGLVLTFDKDTGASQTSVALDHVAKTSRGGNEEGLLGMTLDPQFQSNGYVYLYYNVRPGDRRTQISRFASSGSGAGFKLDPSSELPILTVPQPYANHNGGQLIFGPDGMLYLGLGDGGSQRDPNGNGQDLKNNLLGSIIRVDVRNASAQQAYAIPPDNPFANSTGGERRETWAYGLRNPWRFTFDRLTGRMVVGDVGQNEWEEIDIVEKGGNYGWNVMEGPDCLGSASCDKSAFKAPIAWYGRDAGCSVTGGYVYRGKDVPQLLGAYLYADFCTGTVWSIPDVFGDTTPEPRVLLDEGPPIASFAEDLAGELYLLSFDGRIYTITP